ncbi:Antitoxin Phd_YefM, type II toxin-antitoxin system [Desulfonauticus submarinus]|uniref:Antitoxin n=1 Tax=Desulfonauticus submarinus TaxID=206665 RepID=A0A1H0EEG5_9BACT|nr:type II toxin-antitoxin system Phd/YefM family antitoxin [Desulfonauticus submarinus]SDN80679.1 Antitoxin Phd_YefM, type II toxin-antitoxin system [Desulfonauticus submarinus]
MGALYTYSEARQKFAKILEQAATEGEVLVKRKDGQVFVIKPLIEKRSPLDVPGINLGVSTSEIVDIIRESREKKG